jgi:methionyl-tRNA formyltransferase
MRIIIFGCRKITSDAIAHVLKMGHEIPLVVTHDEERDRIYGSPLVSEFCDLNGIENIRFSKKVDAQLIEDKKPDLIFSIYYRKILRQNVLDIPKLGCINIHPAILPKGRGPAPTMWNILQGDEFAGSTIHYMVEDVDAGDIIDQKIIRINNRTGFELNMDLMNACYELFVNNFDLICAGENNRVPQNHEDAEYCLPFKETLKYVYWGYPDNVLNAIRAFTKPYDGAIAYTVKKEKILIWNGVKLNSRDSLKPPGWFEVTGGGIVVQTNTLPILITEYDLISDTLREKGRFVSGPPVAEL